MKVVCHYCKGALYESMHDMLRCKKCGRSYQSGDTTFTIENNVMILGWKEV